MKNKIQTIIKDSMFMNSFYLMLSTAVMAGLGFIFWVISARLVSTESIGVATALISVMSIISTFSLLGFDSTIVRFLANSDRKNEKINTSIILVGGAALILSTFFVIFINLISPQLSFLKHNALLAFGFIVFSCLMSLNILTDAVFLSYRQTKYTLIINTIFSLVKMFLPIFLMSFGAIGVFLSVAIGQTVGFLISIAIMIWKFDYRPRLSINHQILKEVWKFSLSNYISGALNLVPVTVLPILIINHLGAKESAYFYIVMMILNLLYAVPLSVNRSLFAEGSFNENSFSKNTKKATQIIFAIIIPAIIVLAFAGDKLLFIFGKKYTESHYFLSIMSISAIFISINSIFNSFFRIKHDVKGLILGSFTYSASIVGLSYVFIGHGLLGISWAWITGTVISTIVSFTFYRFYYTINYHKILSHLPYWRGFDDRLGEFNLTFISKLYFLKSFIKNGFKTKTVIFYPETPANIHTSYQILNSLGYKITSNQNAKAVAAFVFEDTTVRNPDPVIEELNKKYKLINYRCNDISKEKVESVFSETFGYGTFVDPEFHNGTCVRKSSVNAVHDGKIVQCPTKKEAGYIYQKFLDTKVGDRVVDIRLIIMGGKLTFAIKRYKNINDPFDNTFGAEMTDTEKVLSQDEVEKVEKFCKEFGLDYGEIDSLRDNHDGKLYLVDANNTPSGPRAGRTLIRVDYNALNDRLRNAFATAFLN